MRKTADGRPQTAETQATILNKCLLIHEINANIAANFVITHKN